ncbi:MAG: HlyD family efflux transporter periplasmic adaptor subunit [Pirellulaceae bacterium]|nr:HlyD family efflux transporter periplasmic adaptor subunit [Pirellulaceae bacterium]
MKTKTWIVLLIVVAAVAAVAWSMAGGGSGVPVRTAAAERGPIDEFLVERAKTRLPRTWLVTMPVTGRIEPIELKEGDPVKREQLVARMVLSDLDLDVDEATAAAERLEEAIRENAEDNVERTALKQALEFVRSMQDTVKAAYERVRSGQARYDYSEKNYGRIATLARSKAKTEDDLDQAELLKVQSDADFRQDQLVYSAMKAMQAATDLMPTMIEQYIGNKSLSGAVLKKQLAEALAGQRRVVENRRRGEMRSPIDGVVLSRFVIDEQHLAAGTSLLELGNLDELEIEAEVLTLEAVDVKVGDRVEIFGPAVGKTPARGTVSRIYPAGFTKISSLGVEQQRVRVIVQINPADRQRLRDERHLEVGYRVYVKIITASKPDALVIPRASLFRGDDNQWRVFVVRAGRAELQTVELGLMNDQSAEVVEGLAPGDRVVLAPESTLADGARVVDDAGK